MTTEKPDGHQSPDDYENTAPKITVLIASYGRLEFLKSAIQSALSQDYPDYEILVIDDGSDDETKNWLREQQQHGQIRVIFQDHQGVSVARSRGVEEAQGALICILDSDDTLVPDALQRLSDKLKENKETVMVYCNIKEFRPNGVVETQNYPVFPTARKMLWTILLKPRVPFKHSGTTFYRDIAVKLGSYDTSIPCKIDIDFYLKFLSAGYHPQLIAEPLVNFKMHKNSISHNRILGIKIWFLLIDRYGPSNPLIRFALKGLRLTSELSKQLYLKMIS